MSADPLTPPSRQAFRELAEANPTWGAKRLARALDMSPNTAGKWKRQLRDDAESFAGGVLGGVLDDEKGVPGGVLEPKDTQGHPPRTPPKDTPRTPLGQLHQVRELLAGHRGRRQAKEQLGLLINDSAAMLLLVEDQGTRPFEDLLTKIASYDGFSRMVVQLRRAVELEKRSSEAAAPRSSDRRFRLAHGRTLEQLAWSRADPPKPLKTVRNLRAILDTDPHFTRWWTDTFAWKIRDDQGVPIRDEDLTDEALEVARRYHVEFATGVVTEHLVASAWSRRRDPVEEWLQHIPAWDNEPRLDSFLDRCGSEHPLNAAYSRCFWLSMMARAMYSYDAHLRSTKHPTDSHGRIIGKVDTMLIMCGPQGAKKSTLFERLLPDSSWLMSSALELKNSSDRSEAVKQIQGKLLVEVQEADAMLQAHQGSVKAFITTRVDTFRASYAKVAADHPRRPVLVGTANRSDLLKDPTGSRRFMPVEVTAEGVNGAVKWVGRWREQLWAETLSRYHAGETWWLTPEEEAEHNRAVGRFEEEDPMAERIREAWNSENFQQGSYNTWDQGVTALQVADAIGIKTRVNTRDFRAIVRALGRLGFVDRRTMNVRLWLPPTLVTDHDA